MMEIARQDNLWLLAPDVACLPGPIVNVYLIGRPDAGDRGWTLIDAGFIGMTEQIARAAARRFGADARPAAILLTHGHFDHVSALKELAERWDVPVYAHALELPYLTGRSSYPPPDPTVGGGLMTRLSVLFPRGPLDLEPRIHALPDDGGVPNLPDWRAIPTPGHAPGHVSFFREADRLLIAGDAFVTTKQESFVAALLKPVYIQGPPSYFTPDWIASKRSVEALAALSPTSAGTGHGRPLAGARLNEALDRLTRDFGRLAVPQHGRYVSQPAVADERGVVSVPPPPLDAQGTRFGGIAAALLAAALLIAIRRRMGASH